MPQHDVAAIANEFLRLAKKEGRALTNMQLQKLPYIAHGWSLALLENPLIGRQPKVWQYGPVYPDLYQALRRYGAGPVTNLILKGDVEPFSSAPDEVVEADLSAVEKQLLGVVWEKYKPLSGIQLSTITHKDGTPWTETKARVGLYASIDNETIKTHYQALAQRNRTKPASE